MKEFPDFTIIQIRNRVHHPTTNAEYNKKRSAAGRDLKRVALVVPAVAAVTAAAPPVTDAAPVVTAVAEAAAD
jgi:hypothetical protein